MVDPITAMIVGGLTIVLSSVSVARILTSSKVSTKISEIFARIDNIKGSSENSEKYLGELNEKTDRLYMKIEQNQTRITVNENEIVHLREAVRHAEKRKN